MKYVVGVYTETCNRRSPVVANADTLFDLLEASRASHGLAEIDYAGEYEDHGDFYTVVGSKAMIQAWASQLELGSHPGASGAYPRAVAQGVRRVILDGELLTY